MGQFWAEITPVSGSILDGRQQAKPYVGAEPLQLGLVFDGIGEINEGMSVAGDALSQVALPALQKYRAEINQFFYETRKAVNGVVPAVRLRAGSLVRIGNKLDKFGKATFAVGTAFSLYNFADGAEKGDAIKMFSSGVDLGFGVAGVAAGLPGAAGSLSYGITGMLVEIPVVNAITVRPLADLMCASSSECE